jgi:hypothetical protein
MVRLAERLGTIVPFVLRTAAMGTIAVARVLKVQKWMTQEFADLKSSQVKQISQ